MRWCNYAFPQTSVSCGPHHPRPSIVWDFCLRMFSHFSRHFLFVILVFEVFSASGFISRRWSNRTRYVIYCLIQSSSRSDLLLCCFSSARNLGWYFFLYLFFQRRKCVEVEGNKRPSIRSFSRFLHICKWIQLVSNVLKAWIIFIWSGTYPMCISQVYVILF